MEHQIGKRGFTMLGRILVKHHPEIARDLLPSLSSEENETDTQLIKYYYTRFCTIRNTNVANPVSPNNKHKFQERRTFIGAILKIYAKEVFAHPPSDPLLPKGFSKELSELLGMNKAEVSRNIRQILFDYRTYDHFRDELECIVSQITSE